jgi:hypothetical protein
VWSSLCLANVAMSSRSCEESPFWLSFLVFTSKCRCSRIAACGIHKQRRCFSPNAMTRSKCVSQLTYSYSLWTRHDSIDSQACCSCCIRCSSVGMTAGARHFVFCLTVVSSRGFLVAARGFLRAKRLVVAIPWWWHEWPVMA